MQVEQKVQLVLVEDMAEEAAGLTEYLSWAGFAVQAVSSGEELLKYIPEHPVDVILLDVKLPGMSGFDAVRRLREAQIDTLIIMFTGSATSLEAMSLGYQLGAIDYLLKPLSPGIVAAKIRALLALEQRRLKWDKARYLSSRVVKDGKEQLLKVDKESCQAWLNGRRLDLAERSIRLLIQLMLHPETTLPRDVLLDRVWGPDHLDIDYRQVDTHIRHLRQSMNDDAKQPKFIATTKDQGYRFLARVEQGR